VFGELVLDGQLVNAGPFVLQEALFKNDLDLTFGDSQLRTAACCCLLLQCYNFLTIFSPLYAMLPSMCHKKKKEGGGSESVDFSQGVLSRYKYRVFSFAHIYYLYMQVILLFLQFLDYLHKLHCIYQNMYVFTSSYLGS